VICRHYKGGLYRVLFSATESTNARVDRDRPLGVVVYVSLTTDEIHVRDAAEFHGDVRFLDRMPCKRFVEVQL
jgi:hypothetical protein